MLGLNSTNGSGESGRLAVAQAAALSRVEDTGGKTVQNFTRVQSTIYAAGHLSSLLHLYFVHHNKLGLANVMPLCTRAPSKSLNSSLKALSDLPAEAT